MSEIDRLIADVEAGKYHDRPSGTPRYYDFGTDSGGLLPMDRWHRMEILRSGKAGAIATLRAYAATQETKE